MSTSISDQSIIETIQQGGQLSKVISDLLYGEISAPIKAFVLKNSGNEADAADIIQEGLQQLILNIRLQQFQGKSSLKTYLYRICRNLWISRLRKLNKKDTIQQIFTQKTTTPPDTPETIIDKQQKKQLLEQALNKLGTICKQVLKLWTFGYSMVEIANKVGYKNANVAKKKKSICMQSLVKHVMGQPDLVKSLLAYL